MPLLLSLGTGYVYLVFEQEKSVRALLQACSHDPLSPDGLSEYYFKMASRRMRCKEVSWRHVLSGLPRAGVRGARSLQASVAHPASQQAWQIFLITLTDKNKPSLGLSGVRTPAPGSRCLSASFPSVGAAPCHVRLGSASPPAGLTGAGVLSACRPAPQASPAAGGLCAPCARSPACLPRLEPHGMFLGSFLDTLCLGELHDLLFPLHCPRLRGLCWTHGSQRAAPGRSSRPPRSWGPASLNGSCSV